MCEWKVSWSSADPCSSSHGCCLWTRDNMKTSQMSKAKRLTKPILFGTLIVGLATAFFNRHRFFQDVEELRAQERARNEVLRMEVLERRQRQIEEVAKKKQERG